MNLEISNVATWLVLVFAVVGAGMVVLSALISGMDPALKLSFATYLERMAVAVGALAVGRGLKASKQG